MTGAKLSTEAMGSAMSGRGALYVRRRRIVIASGAHTSENLGMSSDKESENLFRRKSKVSRARIVRSGLAGS